MDPSRLASLARRLRARGDAINGSVWFAADATGYPPLPLDAPTVSMAARAACLGPVAPEVAAALFAPIAPEVEMQRLRAAWAVTTPAELLAHRERAVVAWLEPVVGAVDGALLQEVADALIATSPAAHPVFAALQALPWPDEPLARLQRVGEMIRERRGDSHRNAWSAAGLDPVELCVLTDAWRGAPIGATTCATMGWSQAEADGAVEALRARTWLDGDAITDAGREARDAVEAATDAGDASLIVAFGERIDSVIDALSPIASAIVTAAAGAPSLRRRRGD